MLVYCVSSPRDITALLSKMPRHSATKKYLLKYTVNSSTCLWLSEGGGRGIRSLWLTLRYMRPYFKKKKILKGLMKIEKYSCKSQICVFLLQSWIIKLGFLGKNSYFFFTLKGKATEVTNIGAVPTELLYSTLWLRRKGLFLAVLQDVE